MRCAEETTSLDVSQSGERAQAERAQGKSEATKGTILAQVLLGVFVLFGFQTFRLKTKGQKRERRRESESANEGKLVGETD